jgi:hypothetical protein
MTAKHRAQRPGGRAPLTDIEANRRAQAVRLDRMRAQAMRDAHKAEQAAPAASVAPISLLSRADIEVRPFAHTPSAPSAGRRVRASMTLTLIDTKGRSLIEAISAAMGAMQAGQSDGITDDMAADAQDAHFVVERIEISTIEVQA